MFIFHLIFTWCSFKWREACVFERCQLKPLRVDSGYAASHTHYSHLILMHKHTLTTLCPFKLPQWEFSSKHHPASTYKLWHQQASDICAYSCGWGLLGSDSGCSKSSKLSETCIYFSEKPVYPQSFNTETHFKGYGHSLMVFSGLFQSFDDIWNLPHFFEMHVERGCSHGRLSDCFPTVSLKKLSHLNLLLLRYQSISPCARRRLTTVGPRVKISSLSI